MADATSNTPVQSDTETPTIRVYVANLGKYNEGELVGAWLGLPQSREKIDEFLRDAVGLTLDSEEAYAKGLRGERVYEEYAIHDFEFPQDLNGFTPDISEYASLDKVNILACLIEQADEDCLEVIEALQNISFLANIQVVYGASIAKDTRAMKKLSAITTFLSLTPSLQRF